MESNTNDEKLVDFLAEILQHRFSCLQEKFSQDPGSLPHLSKLLSSFHQYLSTLSHSLQLHPPPTVSLSSLTQLLCLQEFLLSANLNDVALDNPYWLRMSFQLLSLLHNFDSFSRPLLEKIITSSSSSVPEIDQAVLSDTESSLLKLNEVMKKGLKKFKSERWEKLLEAEGLEEKARVELRESVGKLSCILPKYPKECKCMNQTIGLCYCYVMYFLVEKRVITSKDEDFAKQKEEFQKVLQSDSIASQIEILKGLTGKGEIPTRSDSILKAVKSKRVQLFHSGQSDTLTKIEGHSKQPEGEDTLPIIDLFKYFYKFGSDELTLEQLQSISEQNSLKLDFSMEKEKLSWLEILHFLEKSKKSLLQFYDISNKKDPFLIGELDLTNCPKTIFIQNMSTAKPIPSALVVGIPDYYSCEAQQFGLLKDSTDLFTLYSFSHDRPSLLKLRPKTAYILHKDDLVVLGGEVFLIVEECTEKEELKLSEFDREVDIWPSYTKVAESPSLTVTMYYKEKHGYEYKSTHQVINQSLDLCVGSKNSKPAGQQIFVPHKQTISSLHCRLFSKGGKWCVEDNNSKNGTCLSLAHHNFQSISQGMFKLETVPDQENVKLPLEGEFEVIFGQRNICMKYNQQL